MCVCEGQVVVVLWWWGSACVWGMEEMSPAGTSGRGTNHRQR